MSLIKNPDNSWSTNNEITPRQIEYIEILAYELGLIIERRNCHIEDILGVRLNGDLKKLSKKQGSEIIEKFKEWKGL